MLRRAPVDELLHLLLDLLLSSKYFGLALLLACLHMLLTIKYFGLALPQFGLALQQCIRIMCRLADLVFERCELFDLAAHPR